MQARIEKIIEFSGIGEYIHTPVKRYSSGMYVRLAFAVAAHLDPDILIVDEVLAVGDAEFQKRCTTRMNEVTNEGRTLLFVSHNMSAVRNLCAKAILLQNGTITSEGKTDAVISRYNEQYIINRAGGRTWAEEEAPGTTSVKLRAIQVLSMDGNQTRFVNDSDSFSIELQFSCLVDDLFLTPNIQLFDGNGVWVLSTGNWASVTTGSDKFSGKAYKKGDYRSTVKIPGYLLNHGLYTVNALFHRDHSTFEFIVEEAVSFHVVDTGVMSREYMEGMTGIVRPRLEWETFRKTHSTSTNLIVA